MSNNQKVRILLVDKNSDLPLQDYFIEFTLKDETELKTFKEENELLSYLKEHKNNINDPYNNMIIFNCNSISDNMIDIIKEIKSTENLKSIPLFVIGPNIDDEKIKEIYNAYTNSYIIKPDDFKGLVKLISRFKGLWSLAELP